jgi:hypothetical protein
MEIQENDPKIYFAAGLMGLMRLMMVLPYWVNQLLDAE